MGSTLFHLGQFLQNHLVNLRSVPVHDFKLVPLVLKCLAHIRQAL